MSSKSDHSSGFKSAQSNSNASFESLYSIDDEESNAFNNNIGTGAEVARLQSPNSLVSSLSTEGSPSKNTANASIAASSINSDATSVPTEQKQKRHPPPPSSPYNPGSTSTSSSRNTNNRCAPPIPKTTATQLDPQARLRANALSKCPSVVQKRQNRCKNSRRPLSSSISSSLPSTSFSTNGTNQISDNRSQQHYTHSTRASTPPSSNVSHHNNNNIMNSMPLHTNNNSLHRNNRCIKSKNQHRDDTEIEPIKGEWKEVDVNTFTENGNAPSSPPCERSLHAAALWNDQFLIFGGYVIF